MRILVSASALILTAMSAQASQVYTVVPEIDALAGISALAVIGAVAALVWERKRR